MFRGRFVNERVRCQSMYFLIIAIVWMSRVPSFSRSQDLFAHEDLGMFVGTYTAPAISPSGVQTIKVQLAD